MKKFFNEILFDKEFDQLNNMVRWNGINRIKDESVAHHSFLVTWFTRLMAEEIFSDEKPKLIATTYAIFHDFDEMFTSDILHTVKYNKHNGNSFRKELDKFSVYKINEKFPCGTTDTNNMLNQYLIGVDIQKYIVKLVKLADWLSMRFYLQKEMDLGNRSVLTLKRYCEENIEIAVLDCVKYLEMQNDYKVNLKILKE